MAEERSSGAAGRMEAQPAIAAGCRTVWLGNAESGRGEDFARGGVSTMTTATISMIRIVCQVGHFLGEWPIDVPFPFSFRPHCRRCGALTNPFVGGTILR